MEEFRILSARCIGKMSTSVLDNLFLQLVRIYAYEYSRPLNQLSQDLESLQSKHNSRERALLELAKRRNIKPFEILMLEREGKSEEDAILEFLKREKLTLSDESLEVKNAIHSVNRDKLFQSHPHSTTYNELSKVWYLIPIFFGLLGAIISYSLIKDKDRDMANNILVIGVFFLFINIIFYWWTWMQLQSFLRSLYWY